MSSRPTKPTVAVVGASNNPAKYGFKAVRAYLKQGYTVFPINLHESRIEGLKAFKSVLEVPVSLDRVVVYLPPEEGMKMIGQVAQKGVKELFLNPGAESPALIEKATQLGLEPIVACSIVDIGVSPADV